MDRMLQGCPSHAGRGVNSHNRFPKPQFCLRNSAVITPGRKSNRDSARLRRTGCSAAGAGRQSCLTITCMGNPVRQARVGKQLEREVGDILLKDKVIRKALGGESRGPIASITDVWVSGDLQVAKIQVSLYDPEKRYDLDKAWERLLKLQGYVRKVLGKRVHLRWTPEIRLIANHDLENMQRAYEILERLKQEEEAEANGVVMEGDALNEMDYFDNEDDFDFDDSFDESDDEEDDEDEDEDEDELWPGENDRNSEVRDAGYAFADMFTEKPKKSTKPGVMKGSKSFDDV